ncbi:DUF1289 domain-containing protein [Telmatospirillum sp. J64-1]|uniref:DUF1289 domain-containing protein n=1 Tax=Telmatospirillum sp. J64-1 TaxID=2502183 RepID=UPI00115DA303|nr:DUF1289 domain-containing protein [Telmatospirillum sp. J64-1]
MIESPCINICRIDPDTGLCKGCLRSRAEIKAWRDASDDDRRAILARIEERRRQKA